MPDITEVDALIGQAYDCILEPEGWGELLESCARLVGGESGVVYVKPRAYGGYSRRRREALPS